MDFIIELLKVSLATIYLVELFQVKNLDVIIKKLVSVNCIHVICLGSRKNIGLLTLIHWVVYIVLISAFFFFSHWAVEVDFYTTFVASFEKKSNLIKRKKKKKKSVSKIEKNKNNLCSIRPKLCNERKNISKIMQMRYLKYFFHWINISELFFFLRKRSSLNLRSSN